MAYLDTGAGQLFYEEAGSGAPTLLFVHGLACSHQDWREQSAFFRDKHRIVSLDQRGHGKSDGMGSDLDPHGSGGDVVQLMETLAFDNVVLVGHSMGCRVVLEAALHASSRTAGIVLVDGSRFATGESEAARRTALRAIADTGYTTMIEGLFADMFTPDSNADMRDAIIKRAIQLPESTGTSFFSGMAGWDAGDLEPALRRISAPMLVLQSTHVNEQRKRVSLRDDETTPYLDTIRELRPDARVEIIADAGHFPMLETPERVNDAIARFIASLA